MGGEGRRHGEMKEGKEIGNEGRCKMRVLIRDRRGVRREGEMARWGVREGGIRNMKEEMGVREGGDRW